MVNIIVLLTMTINNNFSKEEELYRRKLYSTKLLEWLKNTDLYICVIESSGSYFKFNHPRLVIITTKIENLHSSSQYESRSILYALDKLKDTEQFKNCDYFLKVTGRYYLNDIQNVLNNIDNVYDLHLQIHRYDTWQNSEYYLIKRDLFKEMVLLCEHNGLMEHTLYHFSVNKKWCHIGPFPNNIPRGGDKLIFNPL